MAQPEPGCPAEVAGHLQLHSVGTARLSHKPSPRGRIFARIRPRPGAALSIRRMRHARAVADCRTSTDAEVNRIVRPTKP
jgi:hypothetical protein